MGWWFDSTPASTTTLVLIKQHNEMKQFKIYTQDGHLLGGKCEFDGPRDVVAKTSDRNEVLNIVRRQALSTAKALIAFGTMEVRIEQCCNDDSFADRVLCSGVDSVLVTDMDTNQVFLHGVFQEKAGTFDVEDYRHIIGEYKHLIRLCGQQEALHTFNLCSDYGIEIEGSTIDKIVIENGSIMFYYNENNDDCDDICNFRTDSLIEFFDDLEAAIMNRNGFVKGFDD